MTGNSNRNQSQHNTNAKGIPNKQPKPEEKTVCSRLEQGIPFRLAQVVPSEMEIVSLGKIQSTGVPLYGIRKIHAYGTAEDIVEYMMDTMFLRFISHDRRRDADLIEVGEGINGPLYILHQYVYAGTVEEIMDHFGR